MEIASYVMNCGLKAGLNDAVYMKRIKYLITL